MPADNLVDKRALNNEWLTPECVLEPTRAYFPGGVIPLDPATRPSNPTGAARFYTVEDDGLAHPWDDGVFVNPPYSDVVEVNESDYLTKEEALREAKRRARAAMKEKARELFGLVSSRERRISSPIVLWSWKIKLESERLLTRPIIALLPCGARFSTWYWQECILTSRLRAMCIIKGRLSFVDGATGESKSGQNNYDSILYGYNVNVDRFAACYRRLGTVYAMRYQHGGMMDGFV